MVLQAKPPPSVAPAQVPAGHHYDPMSPSHDSDPLGRGFGPAMPLMGKKGVKDGLPQHGGGGGVGGEKFLPTHLIKASADIRQIIPRRKGETFNVNT